MFVAQRWDNIWRFQGAEHGSIKSNMSKHVDVVCWSYTKRSRYRNCVSIFLTHAHTYIGIFEYTRKSQFLLVDWIDMSILLLQHPYSLDARPAINKRNIYHHISFKTHETFSFLSSRRQHTPALCKDTWSYHPKRPEKQTTIKAEGQRVRHSSTNKNSGSRQWMQVSPIKVLLYKQCEFITDYE